MISIVKSHSVFIYYYFYCIFIKSKLCLLVDFHYLFRHNTHLSIRSNWALQNRTRLVLSSCWELKMTDNISNLLLIRIIRCSRILIFMLSISWLEHLWLQDIKVIIRIRIRRRVIIVILISLLLNSMDITQQFFIFTLQLLHSLFNILFVFSILFLQF